MKEDECCIRHYVFNEYKSFCGCVILCSQNFFLKLPCAKDPGEKQSIVSVCVHCLFVFGILPEKSPTVVSELVQAL